MSPASKPAPPKPAGPGPKPAAPTRPTPTAPPTRDLAADLDHADLLLRCVELLGRRFTGLDPATRMQLASGVRTARRAVEAAQTPARHASSRLAAVGGGPDRAGGPPAPGADTFSLPQPSTWPGRPFPVYGP